MRTVRPRLMLLAATIALLVVVEATYALAPLGDFDLTLDGVPCRVRDKVRGEYEFPYVIVGDAETYYIKNEKTIASVREQFLGALEAHSPITIRGHVLMVLDDLLVIDEIYSLTPNSTDGG